MKTRKKFGFVLCIVSMLVLTTTLIGLGHTEDDPYVTNLIAGQHTNVGNVSVWNDEDNLYVKYATITNCEITETHLHVATSLDGIPQTKKDNPIPGQFDHKNDSHHAGITEYVYKIPLNGWTVGDELYIAAHAVVEELPLHIGTIGNLEACHVNEDSYLEILFDGETYAGWCADLSYIIECDEEYTGTLYSILDPTAPVDKPENLDLVYYVLNTDYSHLGARWQEIQVAIWTLLDDTIPARPPVRFYFIQAIVDQIVADAYANGEGFVPGEDDLIGFIIGTETLDGKTAQPLIILIPRLGGETAWGDGFDFPGDNWAMYFNYTVQREQSISTQYLVDDKD